MKYQPLSEQIIELEREIARLPEGSIAKKTIKEKEYYYHRISHNGKRTEYYIPFEKVLVLREEINKRKCLEKQLKELEREEQPKLSAYSGLRGIDFKTNIRLGKELIGFTALALNHKKRYVVSKLRDYIFGPYLEKVFILYGLRRTGKTTMIRQVIGEMPESELEKTAFIQATSNSSLSDINDDLKVLLDRGFKYVFIDEVTLLSDFIEGAALLSDIYVACGMKIVLSGTDSLGFLFAKSEQLYDRCILLHATFIPYREFEEVLGIKGIDEYIRYGGTMSVGSEVYNRSEPTFSSLGSSKEYIDTSVAKNIQHSLENYQSGGHFRGLIDLYNNGELTNVINRVVEDMNHRFTKEIVEKTFISNDLSLTVKNLKKDKEKPIDFNNCIDIEHITEEIKKMLDILNAEEQSVSIDNGCMAQIKEYLELLDLIVDIDLESIPMSDKKHSITVISQPGLRYQQAEAIVKSLLEDSGFLNLSIGDRQRILERLLSEISGRMMEEIILLETKLSSPSKHVFKLQFSVGEFDMVVANPEDLTCDIYEIKHSDKIAPEQYKNLTNEEKCSKTEFRYGTIRHKYVIYRGDTVTLDNGIKYLNVEEYLKSLAR